MAHAYVGLADSFIGLTLGLYGIVGRFVKGFQTLCHVAQKRREGANKHMCAPTLFACGDTRRPSPSPSNHAVGRAVPLWRLGRVYLVMRPRPPKSLLLVLFFLPGGGEGARSRRKDGPP